MKKSMIKASLAGFILLMLLTYSCKDPVYDIKKKGIDTMYITLQDSPNANISKYFDVTYEFIKKHIEKGENVLVHCWAGISRSSTIALNYMIRTAYENNKINTCPCEVVKGVINFAKTKRYVIDPNQGFQRQLLIAAMKYQNQWKKDYQRSLANVRASVY